MDDHSKISKQQIMLIVVAALGYFVDIYDLILFNIVKKASLIDIGVLPENIENTGILLFNMQMTGMLIGGLLWGILGDKKGRIKVLFGSILMYSIANIANGFVRDVNSYAIIRFVAGIGLAGELGAGITLIAESMHKNNRGYGTMIVVTFGALGAVLAATIADKFNWQTAYFTGGGLGLALLALRIGTYESGMFTNMQNHSIKKGSFFSIFSKSQNAIKYLQCIMIGLPIWFVVGVLIALSETFAKSIGISDGEAKTSNAVMYCYLGLSVGDIISGLMSQLLKSRKKVVFFYLLFTVGIILVYLFSKNVTLNTFHTLCFLLGAATGYWALFVTIASEQFGTNIRSTVTNTVPNFVRGAVVPITLSFKTLTVSIGAVNAALIVGGTCLVLAFYSIYRMKETFAKDLNYFETL
jgi:MFS transporter, putative metabolite:H+ symporter